MACGNLSAVGKTGLLSGFFATINDGNLVAVTGDHVRRCRTDDACPENYDFHCIWPEGRERLGRLRLDTGFRVQFAFDILRIITRPEQK